MAYLDSPVDVRRKLDYQALSSLVTGTNTLNSKIDDMTTAILNRLDGVYTYKGSVLFANLPSTGMENGDVYNVLDDFVLNGEHYDAGTDVAWTGSAWNALPYPVDRVAAIESRLNDFDGQSDSIEDYIYGLSSTLELVDARIPAAPAANGTYVLQAVVSGGVATYSWVPASGLNGNGGNGGGNEQPEPAEDPNQDPGIINDPNDGTEPAPGGEDLPPDEGTGENPNEEGQEEAPAP